MLAGVYVDLNVCVSVFVGVCVCVCVCSNCVGVLLIEWSSPLTLLPRLGPFFFSQSKGMIALHLSTLNMSKLQEANQERA